LFRDSGLRKVEVASIKDHVKRKIDADRLGGGRSR
jgi:hypothetical protein